MICKSVGQMNIDILTLFPKMFDGFLTESLIKRAIKNKIISINFWDLRKFATDKHQTVDDRPYGGGPGMVLRVDVIDKALLKVKRQKAKGKRKKKKEKRKIILLTPQGKVFNQKMAEKLSKFDHLILVCGHYEGFDERIRKLVDMEISIGDYVLTGGEIPAQVIIDSAVRLIPGVIGKKESLKQESFGNWELSRFFPKNFSKGNRDSDIKSRKIGNLLEYPQYTKPEIYTPQSIQGKKEMRVPKILLSGNHQKINQWRYEQALKRTKKRRPDLLK